MGEVTLSVLVIVLVVSMMVAVVIKGLTALLGRAEARSQAKPSPASPASRQAPATKTTDSPRTAGAHDPRHVAAISAAVAAVFDDSAVVVHIEPVRSGSGWTSESRAAHHTSHNVGRSSW